MVEVNVVYEGNLRCSAEHGPSKSIIHTDAPVDNMGKGEAFSPTDLVGTALGTCILTILGILADRHAIDLRGSRIRVQKEMVTAPIRRIGRLAVDVFIPLELSEEMRQRFIAAAHTCPVHRSLHPDVDAPITFHWGS